MANVINFFHAVTKKTLSAAARIRATYIDQVKLSGKFDTPGGLLNATPVWKFEQSYQITGGHDVALSVESVSTEQVDGASLLTFIFESDDGQQVDPIEWVNRSKHVGNYAYLTSSGPVSTVQDTFLVPAPESASLLKVRGHQWRKNIKTRLVGPPVLIDYSNGESVERMESGSSVIRSGRTFREVIQIPEGSGKLCIRVIFRLPEAGKPSILKLRFIDKCGELILPPSDVPQNPLHGAVAILNSPTNEPSKTEFEISVPKKASRISLEGVDWGVRTADLIGSIKVERKVRGGKTVTGFLQGIGRNTPLLVIDTTAPALGHATLALRPNNLSNSFARLGYAVIFIPFGSLQGFGSEVSDRIFQVPRDQFHELIEACLTIRDPRNSFYISSSFPSLQSVAAAARLKTAGWKTVYEVRDDMEEFNRVGYSKWYSASLERQMLRTAEQIVSVSRPLDEKICSMGVAVNRHAVIPNAVNSAVIKRSKELRSQSAAKSRAGLKTVGYVGHLTKSWFDWPMLIEVAKSVPDIDFEIVGHGAPEGLRLPINIKLLGSKTHDELREIVPGWKAGLIPFVNQPLTYSVDPNKIYEYFAWGLVCVSAPMGNVESYPFTWVYRSANEFSSALREAIEFEFDSSSLARLEAFVNDSVWDARARDMSELIDTRTKDL